MAVSVLGHLWLMSALMTPAEPSLSASARATKPATDSAAPEHAGRPTVVEVRALPVRPTEDAGHTAAAPLAGRTGPREALALQDGAASLLNRQAADVGQGPAQPITSVGSPTAPEGVSAVTGPVLGPPGAALETAPAASLAITPSASVPTSTATGTGPAPTSVAGPTAADEEHKPPPVYATRTPPAFRLSYALRRGAMSGQAELTLLRPGNGYELELKGTVLGLEVLGLSSRGAFGPQGFMPERFVDRRRGKDRLAANFDHVAGRITYSGTPAAQALVPGAQDRLSWMVQLAAILEAAPARYPAGSRIAISVSGARGDVDTWTFIVQGRQRLELPSGSLANALRLTREPRRPYDTQVETWLDPARHHLPVRARLTVLPGGETLELSLLPS